MSRSATIRTDVEAPDVVAAAVRPDNTTEIETRVEERPNEDDGREDGRGVVVTTVERDTTGGLRTTVDDYVVNLAVAEQVVQVANRHADTRTDGTHDQ